MIDDENFHRDSWGFQFQAQLLLNRHEERTLGKFGRGRVVGSWRDAFPGTTPASEQESGSHFSAGAFLPLLWDLCLP